MRYSISEKEMKILRELFPELGDCVAGECSAAPTYNDGGRRITTIWEGAQGHYRTVHSDYGVRSDWTTIQKVERKLVEVVKIRPVGELIYYKDVRND